MIPTNMGSRRYAVAKIRQQIVSIILSRLFLYSYRMVLPYTALIDLARMIASNARRFANRAEIKSREFHQALHVERSQKLDVANGKLTPLLGFMLRSCPSTVSPFYCG